MARWAFPRRHNLAVSHLLELSFGRDRRYLSKASRTVNALLGGYALRGIFRYRCGEPFNVTLGRDVNDDGNASRDRPALVSGSLNRLYANGSQGRTQYLISAAEANARLGVPADVNDPTQTLRRNSFRVPSVIFYDASLIKRIPFGETTNLQFELNVFNLFNRAQFAAPIAALNSSRFGQIISTRPGTTPRQIQLGAKFTF